MSTLSTIRRHLELLKHRFEKNAGSYFNESDLQSELFALLLEDFGDLVTIHDVLMWGTKEVRPRLPFVTRRLHSELLLPEGRIDLAVLDLAHVRVAINSRGRFGHVQLDEDGDHVLVEIKASRTNRSAITCRGTWMQLIQSDLAKLNHYRYRSFLLCFDFGGVLDDRQIHLLHEMAGSNVEFVYARSPLRDRYLVPSPKGGGSANPNKRLTTVKRPQTSQ